MVDFLNRGEAVVIPVGGDFTPTGFIGQWHAAVMATLMTEVDLKAEGVAFDAGRKVGQSEYTRYYWKDYEAAVKVQEQIGNEYSPQTVWVFETPTDSILNFFDDETKSKFGSQLTYDGCRIVTLRSKKYRHELHLIALPAAVQAYAKMKGWDVPEFDVSALTSRDTAFTDGFQAEMIGDPDGDDWENSTLGHYRKELWRSLGESNPAAYKLHGSGTKFDVTDESGKLNEALGILHYPWSQAIYARVIPVFDPRVDAVYTSGDQTKRLTVPALMEIFENQKAAQAAAEADRAGGSDTAGAATGDASSDEPPVPSSWAGYAEDWKDIVRGLKAGGPKPVVVKSLQAKEKEGKLSDEIAATVADVEAWWEFVS